MGWFDEQIRQRKASDQEVFEDSIFRMASVVLGRQGAGLLEDERIITKAAIDEILKYYHFKLAEIPESITDGDEQLEYCLRPRGVMRRNVKLEEGWYKNGYGPMLAYRREDGVPVALIPKSFSGYWYRDPVTGQKTGVTRQNAGQFDADAVHHLAEIVHKGMDDAFHSIASFFAFSVSARSAPCAAWRG